METISYVPQQQQQYHLRRQGSSSSSCSRSLRTNRISIENRTTIGANPRRNLMLERVKNRQKRHQQSIRQQEDASYMVTMDERIIDSTSSIEITSSSVSFNTPTRGRSSSFRTTTRDHPHQSSLTPNRRRQQTRGISSSPARREGKMAEYHLMNGLVVEEQEFLPEVQQQHLSLVQGHSKDETSFVYDDDERDDDTGIRTKRNDSRNKEEQVQEDHNRDDTSLPNNNISIKHSSKPHHHRRRGRGTRKTMKTTTTTKENVNPNSKKGDNDDDNYPWNLFVENGEKVLMMMNIDADPCSTCCNNFSTMHESFLNGVYKTLL